MSTNIKQAILDRLFASEGMKQFNQDILHGKLDISPAIEASVASTSPRRSQVQQAGNSITQIPASGIQITASGLYTFANDITWNAAAGANAAILISAANVTLDLQGHTLTAVIPDRTIAVAGIAADQSASNVTIQNGVLSNMSMYGVLASNAQVVTVINITVTGQTFSNIAQRAQCPSGILASGCSNVTVAGCTVEQMSVTSDSCAGVLLFNTGGALDPGSPFSNSITNCVVADITNSDGAVQGFSLIWSASVHAAGCTARRLQSFFNENTLTTGHTVLGFIPWLCANLKFDNCTADSITGCCDDAHGMSVFLAADIQVNSFTASNVTDGVCPTKTGAKATGLEVYGLAVHVSNSQVSNITAMRPQDLQSTGFSAWGSDIDFDGCTAANVTVVDQNGQPNTLYGNGTGFGWAPDPRAEFAHIGAYNVTYNNCSATNCQVGFDTWYHVDSTWTNVSPTQPGTGILVQPGGIRTLTANACSEGGPSGIKTTITNIASGNTYPGS